MKEEINYINIIINGFIGLLIGLAMIIMSNALIKVSNLFNISIPLILMLTIGYNSYLNEKNKTKSQKLEKLK